MRRAAARGGVVLPVALVVLAVAGAVAAAVAELVRTELVVARSRRALVAGLGAVDACAAATVAGLPAAIDWTSVILGPDGVPGTADDGAVVAPPGCTAALVAGPLGGRRPLLELTAVVSDGERRATALVAPDRLPVPALVWAPAAGALGRVPGRLVLDGVDPARTDLAPLPALAVPDDPAAADAWATGWAVVRAPGTGNATWAPAVPFLALRDELVAAGAATAFVPGAPPAVPAAYLVAGDLLVAVPGTGAGVLYVDGRLDIRADFAFNGLVVARGGVELASGVGLAVAGGLWLDGPGLDVAGDARIAFDRAALDAADGLARLPRRPVVAGILDR